MAPRSSPAPSKAPGRQLLDRMASMYAWSGVEFSYVDSLDSDPDIVFVFAPISPKRCAGSRRLRAAEPRPRRRRGRGFRGRWPEPRGAVSAAVRDPGGNVWAAHAHTDRHGGGRYAPRHARRHTARRRLRCAARDPDDGTAARRATARSRNRRARDLQHFPRHVSRASRALWHFAPATSLGSPSVPQEFSRWRSRSLAALATAFVALLRYLARSAEGPNRSSSMPRRWPFARSSCRSKTRSSEGWHCRAANPERPGVLAADQREAVGRRELPNPAIPDRRPHPRVRPARGATARLPPD